MTERDTGTNPEGDQKERDTAKKAEKHAEQQDVPVGATPEAVAEEEATGGALTNRKD